MSQPLARAFLFALASLTGLVAGAQPPATKTDPGAKKSPFPVLAPAFTAFPDLKPPTRELKRGATPGEDRVEVRDPIVLPDLPPETDRDPLLRKVRYAQVREGFEYLARVGQQEQFGAPDPNTFGSDRQFFAEVCRAAAELEDRLVRRVPWYQARVRTLKDVERYTRLRVEAGVVHPKSFELACFERLQAEADLLALKAEIDPSEGKAPRKMPEPQRPALLDTEPVRVSDPKQPAPFTAFPDLKPPTVRFEDTPAGKKPVEEGRVPLPKVVVVGPDAPLLLRVQRERVNAGLAYIARGEAALAIAGPDPDEFLGNIAFATRLYTVAAALEPRLADRVPWYEARVRKFKEAELYAQRRVEAGVITPARLSGTRYARFGAEADLLALKAEVAKAGAKDGPATKREQVTPDKLFRDPDAKPFTAFPGLKPLAPRVVDGPDGQKRVEYDGARPKLTAPKADAPILWRVRHEQASRALAYLDWVALQDAISGPDPGDFGTTLTMVMVAYADASALEPRLADRVPWYEARVRAFKEIERYTQLRVESGVLKPDRLDVARFERFGAEAELLALKAAVEAAKITPPAVKAPAPMPAPTRPSTLAPEPAPEPAPAPVPQPAVAPAPAPAPLMQYYASPLTGPQVRPRCGLLSRLIRRR